MYPHTARHTRNDDSMLDQNQSPIQNRINHIDIKQTSLKFLLFLSALSEKWDKQERKICYVDHMYH